MAVENAGGIIVTSDSSTVTLKLSSGVFASGGNTVSAQRCQRRRNLQQSGHQLFRQLHVDASDGSLAAAVSSGFTVLPPPAVLSVNRQSPAGVVIEGTSATYAVTFNVPVTGVTAEDFQLALTGGTTASQTVVVSPTSGYSTVYSVTVNGISGHGGTLGLNFADNSSVVDQDGNPLTNANGLLQGQQTYAVGGDPSSVVAADLNGDGKLDLVATNWGSNTVSVLMGNGDGTFQSQSTVAVGSEPDYVAVADLNGDGIGDLVVANSGDNTVSVLLGNGDGTFKPQRIYAVGDYPTSVAIADFSGDGKLDIVATNWESNSVSVLLGNGDGTFGVQRTYAVGSGPVSVIAADVNRDGKLDLVVSNTNSDTVSVLLGNGDGTFHAQTTFATGSNPQNLAVADFNGDGKLDIAMGDWSSNSVSVLLGNGDGTFQTQTTYPVGTYPECVAVADMNGDGKPDLVVANSGDTTVSVLCGNGDGTFQAQRTFATGRQPMFVAAADLNGNGATDLVVANRAANSVGVLLSNRWFTGQTYTIDQPTQLAFTQPPTNTQAGNIINGSAGVQVTVEDSSGSTVSSDSSAVTLTLSGGTFASGGNTVTVTAADGIATFSNLVIDAAGSYTLAASDGSLTGAISSGFNVWPLGDVNHDGVVNAADIDAVYQHFGQPANSQWKIVDDDNVVGQEDVDYLVQTILHTAYGDANLDCKVDFYDFQQVLYHWCQQGAGWAGGDFNGDGVVDYGDFQFLLDNWNPTGTGLGPALATNSPSATPALSSTTATTAAVATVLTAPAVQTTLIQTVSPVAAPVVSGSLRVANVIPALAVSQASQPVPSPTPPLLRYDCSSEAPLPQDDSQVDILTQLCKPVLN